MIHVNLNFFHPLFLASSALDPDHRFYSGLLETSGKDTLVHDKQKEGAKKETIKAMAVVFLFSVWCTMFVTDVQGDVVYSKGGDVVVAALLPMSRGPLCQEKRPKGILLAEAVIHSVSKNHSSALKGNYTLGYYIKDTCGDARSAVRAALELVTKLKGPGENFSRVEIRRKIVAVVVVDDGNSSTQRYVKGILDAFDLPQVRY